jgi:hypothetical protein
MKFVTGNESFPTIFLPLRPNKIGLNHLQPHEEIPFFTADNRLFNYFIWTIEEFYK